MSKLALRILYFEDLSVGMTETLSKTIAASDVVGFAQLTGDRNPIHLSEHFAAKTQFGKRIAHGLYTASVISAVLGTRLPGPGAVYISQRLNFRAPVKIGDQIDATVTVAELIIDGEVVSPDADGRPNFGALQDDLKRRRYDRMVFARFGERSRRSRVLQADQEKGRDVG